MTVGSNLVLGGKSHRIIQADGVLSTSINHGDKLSDPASETWTAVVSLIEIPWPSCGTHKYSMSQRPPLESVCW